MLGPNKSHLFCNRFATVFAPSCCTRVYDRVFLILPFVFTSNKDHYLRQRLRHNGDSNDDGGLKCSPGNPLLSKSPPDGLQHSSLQSTLLHSRSQPSWQSTTTWLRSSPFAVDSADGNGGGSGTTSPTVPVVATDRMTEAAEQRRKLLVELSVHKSRLVELHLRREEVDREVSVAFYGYF